MQRLGLSQNSGPKTESRLRMLLWPDLTVLPEINSTIDIGKLGSFAVAVLSAVSALSGSLAPLIGALVFAAIGFGIHRKSRICAVFALVLYLGSWLQSFPQGFG